jgi:hypothetical protein
MRDVVFMMLLGLGCGGAGWGMVYAASRWER